MESVKIKISGLDFTDDINNLSQTLIINDGKSVRTSVKGLKNFIYQGIKSGDENIEIIPLYNQGELFIKLNTDKLLNPIEHLVNNIQNQVECVQEKINSLSDAVESSDVFNNMIQEVNQCVASISVLQQKVDEMYDDIKTLKKQHEDCKKNLTKNNKIIKNHARTIERLNKTTEGE